MQTQDVTVPVDGQPMPSFLVRPDGEGPRPAVIVLQEIFGVNREVRRIAELVAGAGYVALAINYYHRTHPALNEPYTQDGLKNGVAAAKAARKADLLTDLAAAIAWLDAQEFVEKGEIATIGFCFGGSVAFLSATLPEVKAAIPFYGRQIAGEFQSGEPGALSAVADVKAPLLLFFGGKDEGIGPDVIAGIEAALRAQGKSFEVVVYPEADHGFFRESSAKMEEREIADAWARVKAFLAKHLA